MSLRCLAWVVSILGSVLFLFPCPGTTSSKEPCIRDYNQLEDSLLGNPHNIDSLIMTFFVPNEPPIAVADVLYYVNDSNVSADAHPLIREIEGHNVTIKSQYQFRWSKTPIYLFVDPVILEALCLYTIRSEFKVMRLVIGKICSDYTINGIPLIEYHLNRLTSLLKTYALKRAIAISEGFDGSYYQGYTTYFNQTDYKVIGYYANYEGNGYLLALSLIFIEIFVTIGIPLLIHSHYQNLYQLAKDNTTHSCSVVWASVVVATIVFLLIMILDSYLLLYARLSAGVPSLWQYILAITVAIVLLIFDAVIVLPVGKRKDFPLPYLLGVLFCQNFPCYQQSSILAQTIAMWIVVATVQICTFHAPFIFLAFVASPIRTASTLLLYVAALFCGVSLVALFFATFRKKQLPAHRKFWFYMRHSIYLLLFVCILAFIILFTVCFLQVTVYVGDFHSGGIPNLIASLAPSALLGGMGVLARRILQNYATQPSAPSPRIEAVSQLSSQSSTEIEKCTSSCQLSPTPNAHKSVESTV